MGVLGSNKSAIWVCFALLFYLVTASGCITVGPIPMDTRVGDILIPEKIHLKAAIVTPDPPTHRVYIDKLQIIDRFEKGPRDKTEAYNETYLPLGKEFSKAAVEGFTQLFGHIASLRKSPSPGEYDVVIQAKIDELHIKDSLIAVSISGEHTRSVDFTIKWTINVLNAQGVPILTKRGTTPTKTIIAPFHAGFLFFIPSNPSEDLDKAKGVGLSEMVASLVREWVMMIASSSEMHNYSKQVLEPQK